MTALIARVHVTDDEGRIHVFAPGDDVPQWAASKITNPKAWEDGEAPAQVDLRMPSVEPVKPPVKRAAPRRKAT